MKENLNQITEIYAKKPVKAVVAPKNSDIYKDLQVDDERMLLPELSKSTSPNLPEVDYQSINQGINSINQGINIRQLQGKSPYQSNSNQASMKSLSSKEAIKLKNQNSLAKTRNSRISVSNDPASNL
jgi:hypothetical protein